MELSLGYNNIQRAVPGLLQAVFGRNRPSTYPKELRALAERTPLKERFWRKVDKRGSDDCWEWTACCDKRGYGLINEGGHYGKRLFAHRVSWQIHNGPIPEGLCVCHHCDNPVCVNPIHLFLGTDKDNLEDCVRKGRSARGEKNGIAKLAEKEIHTIRRLLKENHTQAALARMYNVDFMTIHYIKTGRNWGWLE